MKKELAIFSLITLLHFSLFSQTNNSGEDLDYAPTTPETASIGKFTETPVSYFTGIPQINIPLFNLQERSVSVPVALNYHAGGIRVEEDASRVGLGWNLSFGGAITRTVRGLADDIQGGFIRNSNTVDDLLSSTPAQQIALLENSVLGVTDYEADVYNFNFGDYSGEFTITQDGQISIMPHTDLKIEFTRDPNTGYFVGWIITDPNGVKYYFGSSKDLLRVASQKLISLSSSSVQNRFSNPYSTGWALLDIYDPKNESHIKFYYDTVVHESCSRSGKQILRNIYVSQSSPPPNGTNHSYFRNLVASNRIVKITSSNGELQFVYNSAEREDLQGDFSLKEIVLKTVHNTFVKGYRFSYNYLDNKPIPVQEVNCYNNCNYDNKRMFLASIEQFNGTESLPPYVFSYNSESLPGKFSFSQDLWGFYNGKTNNSLIPTVVIEEKGQVINNANRTTDEQYAKAGILESIQYPTGGRVEYDFESNTVVNDLSKQHLIVPRGNEFVTTVTSNDFDSQGFVNKSFTISQNYFLYDWIRVFAQLPCDPALRDCNLFLQIRNSANQVVYNIQQGEEHLQLPPDNYSISGRFIGSASDLNLINVQLSGEKLLLSGNNVKVGGLRVQKISSYTYGNEIAFEKTYQYHYFDQAGSSSGRFTNFPSYYELDAQYSLTDNSSGGPVYYFANADIIYSHSNNPFTTTKGNYVAYSNVTEVFSSQNDTNGRNEYEFSFALDDDSQSNLTPFPPPVSLGWRRGNLIETRTYNKENSLVQKNRNEYTYYTGGTDIFFNNLKSLKILARGTYYPFTDYYTRSEWFKFDSTITTQYEPSGTISSITSYTYNEDETKHVMPIEVTTIDSKGNELKTKSYYAQDLGNNTLIGAYRIGESLKKETYQQNTLLSTQNTSYNTFNGYYLPEKFQASKGSGVLDDISVIHSYYANGQVREVSQKDGVKTVYIWGYNGTLPVAKIENASFSDIPTTIYNSIVSASNNDSNDTTENTLRLELAKLSNVSLCPNLSNSMISTFTHNPLVGVTSMTDPRGNKVYYNYDSFNRLLVVKDQDGNILSENTYNYKN